MGSRLKGIDAYNGVVIYNSANTHPGCKTRSLTTYINWPKLPRFRYAVGDAASYKRAYEKCAKYIDKHKNAPGNNPGQS